MDIANAKSPATRAWLGRSLKAGFVLFLAKGCLWLLVFAGLGELW